MTGMLTVKVTRSFSDHLYQILDLWKMLPKKAKTEQFMTLFPLLYPGIVISGITDCSLSATSDTDQSFIYGYTELWYYW
jgi:hypothetical protein